MVVGGPMGTLMDDRSVLLADVRARLNAVIHLLDDLTEMDGAVTDEEREIITASVFLVRSFRSASRSEVLRWVRAAKAGEESWLVLRSLPRERRADAWFHDRLKPHVRRAVTE